MNCWIEHPIRNLDQTFSYMSEEEVLAGCRVLVPFGNRELTGFVESVEETELSQDGYEKKLTLINSLHLLEIPPSIKIM